jgi:hypothetical protein
MDYSLFDWDDANISHIAEHNVSPEDAEEVLLGDPMELGFDSENGEERWSYVGETLEGRILRVTITMREPKIRVITVFDPSKLQVKIYLAWKAGLS